MADQDLKPISFTTDINPQNQSPLLRLLPGELRDQIWNLVLADYEDTSSLYSDSTCYKRPSYLAPRRTNTSLLRSCKHIYNEAWYLPWAKAEHVFYLTQPTRKPERTVTVTQMQTALAAVRKSHVEPSIEHVRVFAQLFALEPGKQLQEILDMRFFSPRRVTITIRHTDWWWWERDARLHFGGLWVGECRFPDSLMELKVEFESLERKREQIDDVAAQAMRKWVFKRKDGVVMVARDGPPEIMRWSGSATWEGMRWLRDETAPNRLDYYVATVTWRPQHCSSVKEEEEESPAEAEEEKKKGAGHPERRYSIDGPEVPALATFLDVMEARNIQNIGLGPESSAEEVVRKVRWTRGMDRGEDSEDSEDSYDEDDEEDDDSDELSEEDGLDG